MPTKVSPLEDTGWQSFRGPLSEAKITLTLDPGWGGLQGPETIVLGGSGGEYVRAPAPIRSHDTAAIQVPLHYSRLEFVELLNRFFQARFFQLAQSYCSGARCIVDQSGTAWIELHGIADAGTRDLTVELGRYRKSITYVNGADLSPVYVRELGDAVLAFAAEAGMPKRH